MSVSTASVEAHESLSAGHLYRLHLYSPGSDSQIQAGPAMDFEILKPGGESRAMNGLVHKAAQGQSTVRSTAYSYELRPWFHFLKQGTGCRLFQNKTVPEIITAVATEAGYTDLTNSLTATYPKRGAIQ